jgi:sugar-specific transcriptional regulator TrmB
MDLEQSLEKIGLRDKEASVYVALLELGSASVQSIADKAQLKRPTTYVVLESLEQRGLIARIPQAKKALYTIEGPQSLGMLLSQQQELYKRLLPELLARAQGGKKPAQAQLYPSLPGLRTVYNQMLEANEVWFFGTIGGVLKYHPESLETFNRRLQDVKFSARELLAKSTADVAYFKKIQLHERYQVRFLPEGLSLPCDAAIFGNCVALFFYDPAPFALLITSRDFAVSLRSLYHLAWSSATPLSSTQV